VCRPLFLGASQVPRYVEHVLLSIWRRRFVVAFAMVAEIPELTREQYESVVKSVNRAGTPAGALFHAGGPIEGGYRVVEVWESREAADAFYRSDLLHQATAELTTEPKIVLTWQVSGVDAGQGWRQIV
jgi:quinol monooxygenase YgiN